MSIPAVDPLNELEAWARTRGNRFEVKTDYRGEYRVTVNSAQGCGVTVVEYRCDDLERNIEGEYQAWLIGSLVFASAPEDRSEALRPGLRGRVSLALRKLAELERGRP